MSYKKYLSLRLETMIYSLGVGQLASVTQTIKYTKVFTNHLVQ